jgi:glycosyltransferase involved in cell wall biosynthesis
MKVLHISTYDSRVGSAIAACRLHRGLLDIGIDSQVLVRTKYGDDPTVTAANSKFESLLYRFNASLDARILSAYPHKKPGMFSVQRGPERIANHVSRMHPDVLNLHGVCNSFLQIETLAKIKQPLVWRLPDMWAFTGGCHYSNGCERFHEACGACPHLNSQQDNDLSHRIWQRKQNAWQQVNLSIVTPSSWLAALARSSSLFKDRRIEFIPNGLDISRFKPSPQSAVRALLNLPQDKKIVLFGAANATSDPRKGFQLLQKALQDLSQSKWQSQIELVVFGASEPPHVPDFGFKAHYTGKLYDTVSLAALYSAADVMVAPSVQENFAATVLESLACGTPCVAFKIGGMPDLIEHHQNGYLAVPYQTSDLAEGIAWVLDHPERYLKLSTYAREKVEREFTREHQARRYLAFYNEVLDSQTLKAKSL